MGAGCTLHAVASLLGGADAEVRCCCCVLLLLVLAACVLAECVLVECVLAAAVAPRFSR